jgi:hypothetical protein
MKLRMSTRFSPTISHIRDGRNDVVMTKIVGSFALGWDLPVEYSNRVISISNPDCVALVVLL